MRGIDRMSDLEIQLGIITHIARIKAEGHKYEDVKRGLRSFYDIVVVPIYGRSYTYEQLEKKFDEAWGNVIQIKDDEELK